MSARCSYGATSDQRWASDVSVTLVQQEHVSQAFGDGPTVVTPGSATGVGHLLVLAGMIDSNPDNTTAAITDSASNTWVIGNTGVQSNSPPVGANVSAEGYAFIAWVFGAASITSLSLNVTGQPYAANLTLSEWTGPTSFTSGGGGNGNGTAMATPALTLATASDLVIAAGYVQFDDAATPTSPLAKFSSDTTGLTTWGQPGSGSFTPQATNGGRNWAMAAAAFTIPKSGSGALMSVFP
jgi:hypothetical protein